MAKKKLTDWGSLSGDLEKDRKKKEEQKPKTQTTQIGTGINNDWSLLTGDSKTDRSNIAKRQEEYKKSAAAYQAQMDSINRTSKRTQVMMQGFHNDPVKQAQSEMDYRAKELARNTPLYQQISKEARKYSDYGTFNAAQSGLRQSSGNFADSYERYQQASQKAREDYLNELQRTNKSQYYGETLSREQIEGQLRQLEQRKAQNAKAAELATEAAKNDPNRAAVYSSQAGDGREPWYMKALWNTNDRNDEIDAEIARYQAALKYRNSLDKDAEMEELARNISSLPDYQRLVQAGKAMVESRNQKAHETMISPNYTPDDPDDGRQFAIAERKERDALLAAGYNDDLESSYIPEEAKAIYYALYTKSPAKAQEYAKYMREKGEAEYWNSIYEKSGEDAGERFKAFIEGTWANTAAGLDPFGEGGQYAAKLGKTMIGGGAAGLTEKGLFNKGWLAGTWHTDLFGDISLGSAYQLGSSMLQSAANATIAKMTGGLAGITGGLGTILLGSSAAASDYQEKLEQGWDENSAKWHALAAGAAESIFEYVSLDKLVNQDVTRGFLKNFLVQGGVEASEEAFTTIANRITDGVISELSGNENQIQAKVRELMEQGYEKGTAEKMAQKEWLTELMSDALGGFVSGGIMSSGQYAMYPVYKAIGAVQTNRYNEQTGALSSRTGEAAALAQYAADNNLEWASLERSAEAVNQSESGKGETDSSTPRADEGIGPYGAQNDVSQSTLGQQVAEVGEQQKTRKELRQERKESRQIGADVNRVRGHIQEQFAGKTVQEQQAIRDELVKKYGAGMELPVYRAVSMETAKQAAKLDSTDAIRQARETVLAEIQDDDMKRAVAEGYDQAAYQKAAQSNDLNAAAKYIQQVRNTGRGGMSMTATVTGEDGQSRQVKIADMTEDGKGVKLEDGTVVAAKDLVADADTMDVVKQLSRLNLGKDASAVFQAYMNSGVAESEGYRWIMDYATAYEQGRTARISLQQAVERSSLDAKTVMDAYQKGQQYAQAETEKAEERKNKARKKGVTGRKSNIDTSELTRKGITYEKMTKAERQQYDLANKIFELIGVDLKWIASDLKTDSRGQEYYSGVNGSYLNGVVTLDIHAGQNYVDALRSGVLATTGHELTHFLEQYAPKQYKALKEFVFRQIAENGRNGELTLERMIWDKQKRSKFRISAREAEHEVVADACQEMLLNSEAIREFAAENEEAAKGMVRWLKDFFARIKAAFKQSTELTEQAQFMAGLEKDVRKAFGELWDTALREAVRTHDEVGDIESGGAEQQSSRPATEEDVEIVRSFNNAQTETGSPLSTIGNADNIRKNTPKPNIMRYKGVVGKEVSGQIYVHKDYAADVIPNDKLERATDIMETEHPEFDYRTIMYDKAKNTIRFDEAPNFDTAREPYAGNSYTVSLNDGSVKANKFNDYIWHHKWMWVKNGYKGFNVRDSWLWSKTWLNEIRNTGEKVSNRGIANGTGHGTKLWNEQLDYFGLPHDTNETKFSMRPVDPVQPSEESKRTGAWESGHSEAQLRQEGYPLREDVSEDWLRARIAKGWTEGRKAYEEKGFQGKRTKEGTQIGSTESTYVDIFKALQDKFPDTWRNLRVLDASSGMGYGTQAGLEMKFDVTDIEPYVHPDSDYMPDYMDYSSLEQKVLAGEVKPFDVIISNAVLNVIPQDSRDNMMAWFKNVLAPGGMLYINVLDHSYTKNAVKKEKTYNKSGKLVGTYLTQEGWYGPGIKRGNETFVGANSFSVQKGFSKEELRAYVQDALGDGFTVGTVSDFKDKTDKAILNAGSGAKVLVKRDGANVQYSERDESVLTPDEARRLLDGRAQEDLDKLYAEFAEAINAPKSLDPKQIYKLYREDVENDKVSYGLGTAELKRGREIIRKINALETSLQQFMDDLQSVPVDEFAVRLTPPNEYGLYASESVIDFMYSGERMIRKAEKLQQEFLRGDRKDENRFREFVKKLYALHQEAGEPFYAYGVEYNPKGKPDTDTRYSDRENPKPKSAQAQRDAGYKLSESKFYSLYFAHKLDLRHRGDVLDQIENIKAKGFKGDGGFGNNVMPSRQYVSYPYREKYKVLKELEEKGGYGFEPGYADRWKAEIGDEFDKPFPENLSVKAYGPRKGEYILLIPKSGVEFRGSGYFTSERVRPGYKPDFAYEFVQCEYDFQPYYEMYSKAYDRVMAAQKVSVDIDTMTQSAAPSDTTQFSERTWTASRFVQDSKEAAAALAKAIGVTERTARKYIRNINSVARMIADDRVRLDYESAPGLSSFKSNSEYGGSIDFSTLCKKRRLMTGTISAIQNALPNTVLREDDILRIRKMMKEAGLEVSCGLCYVEGSRTKMGEHNEVFLERYKKYYPDNWQPTMADVTTPDGIEKMRINHPEAYEQYEYFYNHYGKLKPGDKAIFASQQKPKMYQLRTEYNGEILKEFKTDAGVEAKNRNGGLRLQSFSDFEIVHLIDCMQVITDMAEVGLAGQAYTKVPEFAEALGKTGLKINLSLITKSLDENGKLVFDDVEGMPHDRAFDIRKKYSKNVGTILVVYDDAQLLAAMADPRIDFIIPFHISQWKKSQFEAMGLPPTAADYNYQLQQNEKWLDPDAHSKKATNYMPNEYWDFSLSGKQNAEKYLEMCARDGKRPKFYKILQNNGDGSYSLKADGSTDGYWKLLIDFKMYDNQGRGVPQMPVKPTFDMKNVNRMLEEYQGGHAQFPVAQGIVDEFVGQYKAEHPGAQYSMRDISEIQTEYEDALADGNQDWQQQLVAEAAYNAGYRTGAYHGSPQTDITVFNTRSENTKKEKLQLLFGTHFTQDRRYAEIYAKKARNSKGTSHMTTKTGRVYDVWLDLGKSLDLQTAKNYMPGTEMYQLYDDLPDRVKRRVPALKFTERETEMGMGKGNYVNTGTIEKALQSMTPKEATDFLVDHGYNSVLYMADYSTGMANNRGTRDPSIIMLDPERIKSAEPVTRGADGEVIPLTERFNRASNDIRYSMRDYDMPSDYDLIMGIDEADVQGADPKAQLRETKQRITRVQGLRNKLADTRAELKAAEKKIAALKKKDGTFKQAVRAATAEAALAREKVNAKGWEDIADRTAQQVDDLMRKKRSLEKKIDDLRGKSRTRIDEERANGKAWERNADLYAKQLDRTIKEKRSLEKQIETLQKNKETAERRAESERESGKAWERNADLYAKQLDKTIKEKRVLENKLAKQLQREEDIINGKLKPLAMQRLLAKEREDAAEKAEAHKDEVFANYKERQRQGDLRQRIRNLSDEMKRRMTNPSERAYVPASLYESMTRLADLLDDVLSPKPGTKAAAKYRAMMDAIHGLAREYSAVKDMDDPTYSSEYDTEIQDAISEIERVLERKDASWLDELTGDTKKGLRELSTGELQRIYELMRSINYSMVGATAMLGHSGFANVFDAMRSVVDQQNGMESLNSLDKVKRWNRLRLLDNLSVMRAVEMMSGWERDAALYQLMHNIEQGTDESWSWVMDYNKSLQDLKTGKNEKEYRNALTKKLDYGVTDEEGRKALMTKLQALQILMTAEREAHNDKLLHLQTGGAVIRDAIDLQNGKGAKSRSQTIKVTPELIQKIQNGLTEWDRAYMKAIRSYFRKEGKRTNEILYRLKHKVLQTEDYYVPYNVDANYLETRLDENQAMNMWVKTPGSTNALKQKAKQPVIIDGMDTVMARHVKEIADYIGLAIPIRDFSKVYNGRLATGEDNPLPVKKTIDRTFGAKGQHLLTQAVIDVQGGSQHQNWSSGISDFLSKLQGAFVKSALLINPSVTIKQAASYIAAESVLSHRALVAGNRALFSSDEAKSPALIAYLFSNPEGRTAKRIYNEIDQHTSLHYQRRLGMSQAEIAEQANRNGPVKRWMNGIGASMEQNALGHAVRKAGENLNPVTWIQRMDVATTATLWVACKEQAKLDGLKAGTEEFWQRTTELYERCIRETQPMYDSLHRTAHQKQAGGLVQFLFPFRTVPIQNHGQLAASYEALKASKGKSKARQAAAKKFFAKTVWAQTESAVVFSVMTFLAALLKRKTKKYRDEDEEFTAESFAKGLITDVGSTLFSVLQPMYGSELVSLGSRAMDKFEGSSGYTYDAFSVGVVDMINDLASSGDKLFADTGKLMRGEDVSFEDFRDHTLALLTKGAKLAGIPADTVKTYAQGLMGNIEDIRAGRIPAINDESWDRATAVNANRFYKAWLAGDRDKMRSVLSEVNSSGKSDESIANAFNARVKEAYENNEIGLEQYADYLDKTSMFDTEKSATKIKNLVKEEFVSGERSEDDTIRVLTEICGMDGDKAWKTVQQWEAKAEHADEEDYSYSQYEDLREALDAGKSLQEAGAEYLEHGYSEKQITDAAVDHLKDRYLAGEISEDEAVKTWAEYKGKDENDAWKKVQEWAAKAEHADDEDYSYSQYDAIDEAIAANQDIKALEKELTDHGVEEKNISSHVKSYLVDRYVAGGVTETALKNQLSRYLGIVAKDDVDKVLNDANSKKQYGVNYSSLDEAYRAGNIKASEMKTALMKYGGLSSADADKKIRWYDLQKANPSLEISESKANTWYDGTSYTKTNGHESAKSAGMSIQEYLRAKDELAKVKGVDANNDGRTDTGSREIAYIRALTAMSWLTDRQRRALYYEEYKGTSKTSGRPW